MNNDLKMSQFFDPKGNPISPKEFVEFYNQCYYLNNSHKIEVQIESLLCRTEPFTVQDLVHIFAWKMSGLDHQESQADGKFHYKKYKRKENQPAVEWADDNDNPKIVNWGKQVKNIEKLIKHIVEREQEWLQTSICSLKDAQKILSDLYSQLKDEDQEKEIKGIGPVYLVTLLYFITHGEYPIYDQQAAKALNAWKYGKEPGNTVDFYTLPEVNSQEFFDIYQAYIESLEDLSYQVSSGCDKERYKKSRDIDRALWVYGHLFKANAVSKMKKKSF